MQKILSAAAVVLVLTVAAGAASAQDCEAEVFIGETRLLTVGEVRIFNDRLVELIDKIRWGGYFGVIAVPEDLNSVIYAADHNAVTAKKITEVGIWVCENSTAAARYQESETKSRHLTVDLLEASGLNDLMEAFYQWPGFYDDKERLHRAIEEHYNAMVQEMTSAPTVR